MKTLEVDNLVGLYRSLGGHVSLGQNGPPEAPWGTAPPTHEQVTAAIESGASLLPVPYQRAYVRPALEAVPTIVRYGIAETIAGAVYDRVPDHGVLPELSRFQIATDHFYRFFLWERARQHLKIDVSERLAPLATFQSEWQQGPFTQPTDSMWNLIGSRVAVVSMPSCWREHPIFWLPFAHETGGHDVVAAIPDFLHELEDAMDETFERPPAVLRAKQGLTVPQFLGALWRYWMSEAVADVCAIMELGPAYAINLAFLMPIFGSPGGTSPVLRAASACDGQGNLDVHPTDLLRLGLAIGATESLEDLSESSRKVYLDFLTQAAEVCAGDAREITLQGSIPIGSAQRYFEIALPIPSMQQAARKVGAAIATTRFAGLGGRSLAGVEGWDDTREGVADEIRAALAAGHPIVGMGDVSQLVAGATLALLDQPARYTEVNTALTQALDNLVTHDPTWGPHPARRMMPQRGEAPAWLANRVRTPVEMPSD